MHNFYIERNGINEGPYTAKEILTLNLPLETMILDCETGEWHPLSDYNMEAYSFLDAAYETSNNNTKGDEYYYDTESNGENGIEENNAFAAGQSNVENGEDFDKTNEIYITLNGSEYLFFYMKDGKKHGPRSAKNMLKQNLPPETPVTESSMNGIWITAGDIDFESFAEHEKTIGDGDSGSSNFFIGLIILIIGIAVTVISYSSAEAGGTYIIATGAIITGIAMMIKG